MNERPFVSIIIPFFNTSEKAFRRCVNSLINQTNGDFEAIIINDGSFREYDHLLEEVSVSDSRIRLINKVNEGAAITKNIGIGEACGEYIMFLDSDDALTDYCLEEAAQVVNALHPDLVLGTVKRVTEEEIDTLDLSRSPRPKMLNVVPGTVRDSLMTHMIGLTDATFLLQNGYIGDGPVARLLLKSIADVTLFSKEAFWSEDTIWNLEMLKKCERITIIDNLWYKYLICPNSQTRKFRPDCPYEFVFRTRQELDLVKKLWPNCMAGVYSRIFNDISILCRTFLFHSDNPKSLKERYIIYKECIHKEAYRQALKCLDLKREKRIVYRIAKVILRFTAYHGPNIISYWMLWVFHNLRKDTL